jgi:hypothetical protein
MAFATPSAPFGLPANGRAIAVARLGGGLRSSAMGALFKYLTCQGGAKSVFVWERIFGYSRISPATFAPST